MFAGEKRPRQPQPLASSEEGVDAQWDRSLKHAVHILRCCVQVRDLAEQNPGDEFLQDTAREALAMVSEKGGPFDVLVESGKVKALQAAMMDHDDAEKPLKRKALEALAAVKHHLKHRTTTLGKAPTTLGKEVDYPSGGTPTPGVLDAIPRAQSAARKRFGAPRGEGVDVWNAYEVLYLQGPKRRVRAAALEMRVPSTSPCLVESKSFKLYLFSLRRCQFAGDAELLATISADLAPVLGAVPQLALDQPRPPRAADYFDRVLPIFAPGPAETTAEEALAAAAAGSGEGAPVEAVNVLVPGYMSLCPVTGQPDFADVEIYYNGPALDWSGVAEYFARKFEHQAFHEECVETFFGLALATLPGVEALRVRFCYTRRGGIDINPVRAFGCELDAANYRFPRQ